jgi:hypothetical protein
MQGAVYLAGYAIECMLKALIMEGVPAGRQDAMLRDFRGNVAHDFGWLRRLYLTTGGKPFSREMTRNFTDVRYWSTELRYDPKVMKGTDPDSFLQSAEAIMKWADGRL